MHLSTAISKLKIIAHIVSRKPSSMKSNHTCNMCTMLIPLPWCPVGRLNIHLIEPTVSKRKHPRQGAIAEAPNGSGYLERLPRAIWSEVTGNHLLIGAWKMRLLRADCD